MTSVALKHVGTHVVASHCRFTTTVTHEILNIPQRNTLIQSSGSNCPSERMWWNRSCDTSCFSEACVIAAGAVVTRDCAPHGLYRGIPARRVRDLHAKCQPVRSGQL